jgi:hypothetical protein
MKQFAILIFGMVLGSIATVAVNHPQAASRAAHDGVDTVQTKVRTLKRERCVRDFLDETRCFQSRPARECDALIVATCGVPQ